MSDYRDKNALYDAIKNSDYLHSALNAHRDGTAEVIAILIGTIVADDPALAPKLIAALKRASELSSAPSAQGDRNRIIEKILKTLQTSP
nr:MAG TPA: two-partite extracellular sensor domain protein [Caudoviricetes sp.]